ncbi:hypothetical protein FE634_12560 [Nocardioides dongxiaopingii]|uniref:Z1 domain-containing protein n=1 Tax=Nocardioides sp. S-1144 TaxID=2582905 RepID=UPI00110E9C75|nr:Z1 domain-containing protein [Nocardioides sp. S-1144]QCW51027.1 hypothetical protein FE634_12560 [Nocardioides sp. S-1144]
MSVFREATPGASALKEYLNAKRREFVGAVGEDVGSGDAIRLSEDLERLSGRAEEQLLERDMAGVCYLVMGKVQSGKTGSQLGMLSWAADRCDVAVIFTGVTEALNGQTTDRINSDLSGLPSSPVIAMPVPTRAQAEKNEAFLESVVRRTQQRRDWREGEGLWPERLPILVSMKTKPRVDALKWLFGKVAEELGEGVTALIIDDEADQASPNAATRRNEEAATYAELKALRDAAKHHVWLSYTATPQAIFLTELDGALRPDYCAVTRPGTEYFGVADLVDPAQRHGRVTVADWPTANRSADHPPASMRRAVADVLCAGWLRAHHPDAFYRRGDKAAHAGMRSVQMLVHTSSKTQDHVIDYGSVQTILADLRQDLEDAIRANDASMAPTQLAQAWSAIISRANTATGSTVDLPDDLGIEHLYQIGKLIGQVEVRVVNSSNTRPTAEAGALPIKSAAWEAHPVWIVIGGDILGRGLTFPQLTTTYFTRIAQTSNEDTVSQQMRFCGYRSTYAHVVTVHALADILEMLSYLAHVERVLMATAEEWDAQDKNLRMEEPSLWYVARPTNRARPTRLAVRTRELDDISRQRQVLAVRQFVQPQAFQHNSRAFVAWLEDGNVARDLLDEWQLVECGAEEVERLLRTLRLAGRDDAERDVALELLSPRLRDLGLANLPFTVIFRGLDELKVAASGHSPDLAALPVRALAQAPPTRAFEIWENAWSNKSALQPHEWYDEARIGVPHIGDAQRAPIAALGYDAITMLIEPLAVHSGDESSRLGGGLAMTIQTPDGFAIRMIGVKQ